MHDGVVEEAGDPEGQLPRALLLQLLGQRPGRYELRLHCCLQTHRLVCELCSMALPGLWMRPRPQHHRVKTASCPLCA